MYLFFFFFFLFSPTNIALSSIEQIKMYLQTMGTCKCGLECPVNCESVFNFNPKVSLKKKGIEGIKRKKKKITIRLYWIKRFYTDSLFSWGMCDEKRGRKGSYWKTWKPEKIIHYSQCYHSHNGPPSCCSLFFRKEKNRKK